MRECTKCFSATDDDSEHCRHCTRGASLVCMILSFVWKFISKTFVFAVWIGVVLLIVNMVFAIIYSASNDEIDYHQEQNSKNNETYQLTEMYW